MRLAFVVYGGLDNVSGGFIYDRALACALGALGHQVDIVGLPWHGYLRAVAGSVLGARRPAERGGARRYDAVLCDELCHPSVFRRVRSIAAGAITVALVHNLACEQPRARLRGLTALVERRFLAGVDGTIAVCQRTLAGVHALGGDRAPGLIARPGRDPHTCGETY